ncbi:MAG TPA: two-component system regulatory protein YycI [Cerasibacillus sp.]|uniref:two-component system regulatory protein YycI n=1 Tax=Cerasibacillus sp. TaxID=2498711 RepID=UPI002F42D18E
MQWSQIKTLFILCFLVLDIYLIFQFIEKQQAANIGLLEREEITLEQQLKDDDITIENTPNQRVEEAFIKVRQKDFSKEDRDRLEGLPNQEAVITNENHLIISQFKEGIALPDKVTEEQLQEIVQANILYGDEYQFGEWNKEKNVIYFFPIKNGRPVYFNPSGVVVIYLNEKNEIILYTQTRLDKADINSEKKPLIHPVEAVGRLYNNQHIVSGDTVNKLTVGYQTVVPLADGVQVFVPTWKITVNKEKSFFVNATEGIIFTSSDEDFLYEEISNLLSRMSLTSQKVSWKKSVIDMLENKMTDLKKRSETK